MFSVYRILCVEFGIKEYLQTYIRFPQTQQIFLAGEARRHGRLLTSD